MKSNKEIPYMKLNIYGKIRLFKLMSDNTRYIHNNSFWSPDLPKKALALYKNKFTPGITFFHTFFGRTCSSSFMCRVRKSPLYDKNIFRIISKFV